MLMNNIDLFVLPRSTSRLANLGLLAEEQYPSDQEERPQMTRIKTATLRMVEKLQVVPILLVIISVDKKQVLPAHLPPILQ